MGKSTHYPQNEQKRITALVTNRFKQFYLTGGTALSFYFKHRFSDDLDFFTQKYKSQEPDQVIKFISQKIGSPFHLQEEQDNPRLVPMKIYTLKLKGGEELKIDFVKDFAKNLGKVKKGLHSVEDIYFRKIMAVMGPQDMMTETGMLPPSGRQRAKDLFDLYHLSVHHQPLVDFFLSHFSPSYAPRFIAWYRRFDRMDIKLDLSGLVPGMDTGAVLQTLDDQILKKIPEILIRGGK